MLCIISKESNVEKIKMQLLLKDTSFYSKMHEWIRESGGVVVPFYSTDIYYNMIKRLVRKRRLKPVSYIQSNKVYNSFRELLKDIEEALGRSDEHYKNEMDINFKKCFNDCPVIQRFMDNSEKGMAEIFEQMVIQLANKSNENKTLEKWDKEAPIFD